jgi:hypothetical protein
MASPQPLRSRLFAMAALAALSAACGGAPTHRLARVRFSDSDARASESSHHDAFDARFELGHAPYVHAHLEVEYTPGWLSHDVRLTCTLTGPTPAMAQKIDHAEALPRGQTATTWVVVFAKSGATTWVPGTYGVTCETPTSSITSQFQVVDTTALTAQAGTPLPLADLLGKTSGRASVPVANATPPVSPAAAAAPAPDAAAIAALLFDHAHDDAAAPARKEPVVISPRMYSTNADLGDPVAYGDRFDAGALKYLGYELNIPASAGAFSMRECAFERTSTGVVQVGSTSTTLGDSGLTSRGSYGSDYGGQWIPDEYQLRCDADTITIPPLTITVYGRSQPDLRVTRLSQDLPVPDTKATSLQFFEFANPLPPYRGRQYYGTFSGSPRMIGAEVRVAIKPVDHPLAFKFTCNWFTDAGDPVGRDSIDVKTDPGATWWFMTVGWGNNQGNFWKTGTYYTECDADGVFVASRFFRIVRE